MLFGIQPYLAQKPQQNSSLLHHDFLCIQSISLSAKKYWNNKIKAIKSNSRVLLWSKHKKNQIKMKYKNKRRKKTKEVKEKM